MIRLAIRVRRADAEVALAELLVHAPRGVEEVDLGSRVEYALYGAPSELPARGALEAAVGSALVEVVTTEVADDWHERWRDFHRPVELAHGARRLHVRAPWHPVPAPGVLDVAIDPGQAFGTGAHPTTRLCLELMLELAPGGAVMDLGCGAGVLALAAARLGFGPVSGLDHEAESVAATRENARVNGVAVSAAPFDLLRDGPAPCAPIVLANLLRPLLLHLARAGFAGGEVPRTLIASGLLAHEADEVAVAFSAAMGLRETDRRHGGEWAALLLQR